MPDEKIESYGISGETLSWIREFLHERRQKVVIKGESSSWNDVNNGVPQGSVLGTIVFILFINELPANIQSSIYLFADDTKVFNPLISSHEANKFQQYLVELHLWTEKWLLTFHPDKCVLMLLGKNHYNRDLYLPSSREPLRIVNQEKDIGVKFDDKLSFSIHITEQVNKVIE